MDDLVLFLVCVGLHEKNFKDENNLNSSNQRILLKTFDSIGHFGMVFVFPIFVYDKKVKHLMRTTTTYVA